MSDAQVQHTIAQLVPEGAHVLDLGCGDGALLQHLITTRRCTGYGIEIDDDNVLACVRRGVNVLQLNLHEGLKAFRDQSFDAVLQIDTLQHLRNAEVMLRETARVGRVGIVAFPNFAHWPNRLSIARKNGLQILDAFGLEDGRVVRWLPNARAGTAVFKLQRA